MLLSNLNDQILKTAKLLNPAAHKNNNVYQAQKWLEKATTKLVLHLMTLSEHLEVTFRNIWRLREIFFQRGVTYQVSQFLVGCKTFFS